MDKGNIKKRFKDGINVIIIDIIFQNLLSMRQLIGHIINICNEVCNLGNKEKMMIALEQITKKKKKKIKKEEDFLMFLQTKT